MHYRTLDPYTEELVETFDDHDDAALEDALERVARGWREDWRLRSYPERGAVLRKAAALLRGRADELAALVTQETGKLLVDAHTEVRTSAEIVEYFADHGEAMLAPRSFDAKAGRAIVAPRSIGPIFAIEPWNLPYYQLARVAGPQLMAGNTVIVKHAPSVPRCALAFEAVLRDAGVPEGAYVNLFLSNEQAASVVADERIAGVALTGSGKTGQAVAGAAGAALKKSTMELGGSDAFLVLDDADVELAVRLGVQGRMYNTGQACAGAKRFILHDSVADAVLDGMRAAFEDLRPGDPRSPDTTLAPLSSEAALTTALGQVRDAVEAGARVVTGGERLPRAGFFLQPTILEGVTPDNPVFHQEIFAPVAMAFRVGSDEEAITLANDSPFGLGGSVITEDRERGQRIAGALETGMTFINNVVIDDPATPFGGVKASGFGRELSDLGITEFVNHKLITIA